MSEAEFASWAMKILLTGLIIFLGFIVWNLGKRIQSRQIRHCHALLGLGLGVFGFYLKRLLISFLVLPK